MASPAEARAADDQTTFGAPELHGLASVLRLLAGTESLETLLGHLPSNPGPRLHVGYEEAAARLGIPEKWLRERIATLPHRKMGRYVQFTAEDLKAISDMHFVGPSSGAAPTTSSSGTLTALRPSSRSRTRA
ncbi:DNA-binding protein [Streptomyces monomycini]|uniref:DNA-binding protein n=1 Tax=Streptomyces monomycini TaxID=371720 RepID=UPI00067D1878|nr:DNA-binding protein [Streptomyces monomycini]